MSVAGGELARRLSSKKERRIGIEIGSSFGSLRIAPASGGVRMYINFLRSRGSFLVAERLLC